MAQWFDPESPIMTALANLLDWFLLSLLTMACSIPLVTIGPAWTALYGVLADRAKGTSQAVVRGYFIHVRRVFRPALVNWLLFCLMGCFLRAEFHVVGQMPDQVRILFWAGTFLLAFCLLFTGVFLLPLLCADPAFPQRQLWKAAFVQGVARLPRSLKISGMLFLPGIVFFFSGKWFWLLTPVWIFLWPAASAWLWVRLTAPLSRDA